jgi:Spy/CpxP family protein refolding chaperone
MVGGAVLVLAFVAGTLGGAALERVRSTRGAAAQVAEERSSATGEIDCERYRQRRRGPFGALGLTEEQAAQIDRIFEEQRTRMDAFWVEAGPRMSTILDETRAEVRAVLNEEQNAEYERKRTDRRAREQAREQQDSIRRAEIREHCGLSSTSSAPPPRRP